MPSSHIDDLQRRYAAMTQEQFASLKREDLTPIAQHAYNREVERRNSPEWQAEEARRKAEYERRLQAELKAPKDIGGWLVLPAIGLVLGPIISVVSLIAAMALFSDVEASGYGGIYQLELLVQLGLLAFLIYAAMRFFGKKSNAPSTIITLLIASLVASAGLLVIELSAGAEEFAIESGKQLVRDVIWAAIWIPYFRVSKRVKATFVN